jgi:hypothetical protein
MNLQTFFASFFVGQLVYLLVNDGFVLVVIVRCLIGWWANVLYDEDCKSWARYSIR